MGGKVTQRPFTPAKPARQEQKPAAPKAAETKPRPQVSKDGFEEKDTKPKPKDKVLTPAKPDSWKLGNKVWSDDWLAPT